ncbi:hypothetical protein D3C71_2225870 [compost metagenome]
MVLSAAQTWMLNNIRQAALQGELIEYTSFPDNAARQGEQELIRSLQGAVKEESEHADHR